MGRIVGLQLKKESKELENLNVGETVDNGQEPKELEDMTTEELQEFAKEHSIDIGNATSVNGIIKKINEALKSIEA